MKFKLRSTIAKFKVVPICVLALISTATQAQEAVTARDVEIPVIDRPVHAVSSEGWADQIVPVFRTTKDGRLGLNFKNSVSFVLNNPEKMTTQFHESPLGQELLAQDIVFRDKSNVTPPGDNVPNHVGFCEVPNAQGEIENPYSCGAGGRDDCYDIKVIAPSRSSAGFRFAETPTTVRISNPKTANARIAGIDFGRPRAGRHTYPGLGILFEPVISEDGNLLVARAAHNRVQWTNERTGQRITDRQYDMVYFGAPRNPRMACNVDQWATVKPLSHAPFDPVVNTSYGFAMQPFRSPTGAPIEDGADMSGSYPWMDADGDNVGFSVHTTLLRDENRLDVNCLPQHGNCGDSGLGGNQTLMGKVIMGLWTQGKMILADNLINHMDYGDAQTNDTGHRLVSMYRPGSLNGGGDGVVRVGAGRDTRGRPETPNNSTNNTFFESIENKLNFWENMRPVSPFDIVWHMSTGATTDEFVFDDYLYTEAFIISSMTQATEDDNNQGTRDFNGVNRRETYVQNGAASTRWNLPRFGNLQGSRIERAALGGVHGKGAWQTGRSYIHYDIARQPRNIRDNDWHISLFVDARYNDNGVKRLINFPDGSELQLVGRGQVRYRDGNNDIHQFNLPEAIPNTGWAHLGVQMTNGNETAEFYYNGFLLNRFTHNQPFFEMSQGDLYVGSARGNSGFRGWIDDFKVIAHHSGDESWCNHANGTLAGISGNNRQWTDVASGYPAFAHNDISNFLGAADKPTFNRYACYHDYSGDYAAHAGNMPASLTHVGDDYNFPEGPLVNNQPRPESRNNEFCTACHSDEGLGGLDMDALALQPNLNAIDDPRRQPLQPNPLVFGNIPANWLGQGRPDRAMVAPSGGLRIDNLLAGEAVTSGPTAAPQAPAPAAGGIGAEGDVVTFYADANFRGVSWELPEGEHDFHVINDSPIGNNAISSVRVPEGYLVYACHGGNHSNCGTLTSDHSRLDGGSTGYPFTLDDSISFMIISRISVAAQNNPAPVVFYRDGNFSGTSWSLGDGGYDPGAIDAGPIGTNQISSIRVPAGRWVLACQNRNFGCEIFQSDQRSLINLTPSNVPSNGRPELATTPVNLNDQITYIAIATIEPTAAAPVAPAPVVATPSRPVAAPSGNQVVFYEHHNYTGASWAIGPGIYRFGAINSSPVGNDAISSFRVPNGFTVEYCEHGGGNGNCQSSDRDQPNLTVFNDQISYIRITER